MSMQLHCMDTEIQKLHKHIKVMQKKKITAVLC